MKNSFILTIETTKDDGLANPLPPLASETLKKRLAISWNDIMSSFLKADTTYPGEQFRQWSGADPGLGHVGTELWLIFSNTAKLCMQKRQKIKQNCVNWHKICDFL